jgi:hypothetical protein
VSPWEVWEGIPAQGQLLEGCGAPGGCETVETSSAGVGGWGSSQEGQERTLALSLREEGGAG